MKITYSDPKDYLERPGKWLITSLGLRAKARQKNAKKASYAITNVSIRDLSKIIREFEKLTYKIYGRRMPKYEPTDN